MAYLSGGADAGDASCAVHDSAAVTEPAAGLRQCVRHGSDVEPHLQRAGSRRGSVAMLGDRR